jgi:hypothetical protein
MSGIELESNQLSLSLRQHWPRDRPVLYHGTRYGTAIAASDRLNGSEFGMQSVSLTRRPEVACYWAMMPRNDPAEDQHGTVFVLDRSALQARYRLDVYRDPVWDADGRGRFQYDEAEEMVWPHIERLTRFIIASVRLPT